MSYLYVVLLSLLSCYYAHLCYRQQWFCKCPKIRWKWYDEMTYDFLSKVGKSRFYTWGFIFREIAVNVIFLEMFYILGISENAFLRAGAVILFRIVLITLGYAFVYQERTFETRKAISDS